MSDTTRIFRALNDLEKKVKDLEATVQSLRDDAGEDYLSPLNDKMRAYGMPFKSHRTSAMHLIRLVMDHLGLELKHIEPEPYRNELVKVKK